MSRAVMQQALEALSSVLDSVDDLDMHQSNTRGIEATPFELVMRAVESLRAELAKTDSEPVASMRRGCTPDMGVLHNVTFGIVKSPMWDYLYLKP